MMSDVSFKVDYKYGVLKLWVDSTEIFISPPRDNYGRSAWWTDISKWRCFPGDVPVNNYHYYTYRELQNWINDCIAVDTNFRDGQYKPFMRNCNIASIDPHSSIVCISDCNINSINGGSIIDIIGGNINTISGKTKICNIYGGNKSVICINTIKDYVIIENVLGATINTIGDYVRIKSIVDTIVQKMKGYASIWIAKNLTLNYLIDNAEIKEVFDSNIAKNKTKC